VLSPVVATVWEAEGTREWGVVAGGVDVVAAMVRVARGAGTLIPIPPQSETRT
jgi:hypothetical protein